jgi:4-diphosphocytidyl-2-C-methyl-D-erythritol kinase
LHYVVAVPEFGTSTREVYKKITSPLTSNVKNVKVFLGWCERAKVGGGGAGIGSALFNRLEEVVCAEYPQLVSLKRRLTDLGCSGALVTGSGSCVYGIASDESAAARIAGKLAEEPGLAAVHVVHTL